MTPKKMSETDVAEDRDEYSGLTEDQLNTTLPGINLR